MTSGVLWIFHRQNSLCFVLIVLLLCFFLVLFLKVFPAMSLCSDCRLVRRRRHHEWWTTSSSTSEESFPQWARFVPSSNAPGATWKYPRRWREQWWLWIWTGMCKRVMLSAPSREIIHDCLYIFPKMIQKFIWGVFKFINVFDYVLTISTTFRIVASLAFICVPWPLYIVFWGVRFRNSIHFGSLTSTNTHWSSSEKRRLLLACLPIWLFSFYYLHFWIYRFHVMF